jgi:hypothetical protein
MEETRRSEILEEVTQWSRDWLDGAIARYAESGETFDIGVIGVAFDIHYGDGTSGVGYTCSDGRPWVHSGLFRAAMRQADGGATVEVESASIFTALINVVPEPGNDLFDGAPGAYTNVYARVSGEGEFRDLVDAAMKTLGLSVREIEQISLVDPDQEEVRIRTLLCGLSDTTPWVHDTFHVYESAE